MLLAAVLGTVQCNVLPLPKRDRKATLQGVDCRAPSTHLEAAFATRLEK